MTEFKIPKLDDGKVNPKEIYNDDFWKGKGSLREIEVINFAIIEAIQKTDFETEDLLENVIKNLTEFSGSQMESKPTGGYSVGGWKSKLFMQGTGIRLKADDQKERKYSQMGDDE